ncbi:expressed unknown protein [Seminavis robusta]|uniref:Uncharacterized protein n=1 Tax=Seminavis robusta TaxID=568900 RepID=A0A9N8HS19_9STRA|nr:expressed unknown protein [Seminavis robusta]|eukprot:Sro1466_g275030.1 n/a (515) ;mRNA; r:9141-10685
MPSTSPKKRKATPSSSTKKKKAKSTKAAASATTSINATQSNATKTVTIHVNKPDATVDPILVSFPGGVPTESPPLLQWSQKDSKNPAGRTIRGQNNQGILYTASSNGIAFDERSTKLAVGVYDRHTGTLTIHQTASRGTVYSLQQHLLAYKESLQPEMTDDGQVYSTTQKLFDDFGSAKKQRVLKSQAANRVNVDTVIGSGIAQPTTQMSESNRKAVEHAKQNPDSSVPSVLSAIEIAHEKARKELLPPFDMTQADQPCAVFQFHQSVTPEAWATIGATINTCLQHNKKNFVQELTRGKPRMAPDGSGMMAVWPPEKRGWSQTILDTLQKAPISQARTEDANVAKTPASAKYELRCILLLHYMIRFYTQFHRSVPKGRRALAVEPINEGYSKWYGIPNVVAQPLLDQFATEQADARKFRNKTNLPGMVMSPTDNDKCLVHILLLYVRARGGAAMKLDDLVPLLEEFAIDQTKATQLLRTAGCTIVPQGRKIRVVLTAPVTFPKPKRMGGNKAKR